MVACVAQPDLFNTWLLDGEAILARGSMSNHKRNQNNRILAETWCLVTLEHILIFFINESPISFV